MLEQVRSTISRHGMVPEGARVIAAVSGGADSVALLHILREVTPSALVGIAHFNHQLRGAESEEDEAFVAALAVGFRVPFYRASADVGAGNLEQNARRARHAFFRELIARGAGDRIALAHTLDDQAETVLFRMLRGSGLSGLVGILPVTTEGVVRPLLEVRREDVRAYLREHRIGWREDASNLSLRFARNRIRHTLLPELERDWNPQIVGALAHLADVAYEEEVWWAGEIARYEGALVAEPGWVEIFAPPLAAMPKALLRRFLRHAVRLAKGDLRGIEYAHIEALAGLATSASGPARRALPGLTAVRSFEWVLLRVPGARAVVEPFAIPGAGEYRWPTAKPMIHLAVEVDIRSANACDTLDLELRGWQAGDQYRPQGHQHPVKVKDLFQKARVPSWRRASWPIITGRGKILWANEFGPSAEHSGIQIREIPNSAESFDQKLTS